MEKIVMAARASRLSQKQVEEVLCALKPHAPHVDIELFFVKTYGDLHLDLSLRELDKTDIFTREIDAHLLQKTCRIAVHSAKDLPEPLPKGLTCIAITKGQTAVDALVLLEGQTLEGLALGAWIGSSSKRRDQIVQSLRPDLRCKDVRGTIEKRLELLDKREIEGLVVAEAALVRLGLTGCNRIILPGKTAPLQGKLAILAREGDDEMKRLFRPLDTRDSQPKRCWYTGLSTPSKKKSSSSTAP